MNRKSLLISLGILFVALCVLVWFFLFRQVSPVPTTEEPSAFNPFPSSTTTVPAAGTVVGPKEETPRTSSTSPAIIILEKECSGTGNVFEKNDCVSSLAVTQKNKTLCDYVVGSMAQQQCRDGKTASQASAMPQASLGQSYETFLNSYFSKPIASGVINANPATSTSLVLPTSPTALDKAAVLNGLTFGAPLAVYAASRYQMAPGSAIKIYGSGFTKTDNVLNIGSQQFTLNSADGSSLDAIAPGSTGEYEIWVTNSKGSSKVAERPIKITVTDSPAPLPTIERASPSPVSITGTVTLTGTGFGSSVNVLTSMGTLQNVSSSGTSISFAMSSLPYSSYSKDVPELKGKIIPLLVTLQTSGGVSEKIFQVDVQF